MSYPLTTCRTLAAVSRAGLPVDLLSGAEGVTAATLHTDFGGGRAGFMVESEPSRDVRPAVAAAVVGRELLQRRALAPSPR